MRLGSAYKHEGAVVTVIFTGQPFFQAVIILFKLKHPLFGRKHIRLFIKNCRELKDICPQLSILLRGTYLSFS